MVLLVVFLFLLGLELGLWLPGLLLRLRKFSLLFYPFWASDLFFFFFFFFYFHIGFILFFFKRFFFFFYNGFIFYVDFLRFAMLLYKLLNYLLLLVLKLIIFGLLSVNWKNRICIRFGSGFSSAFWGPSGRQNLILIFENL